MLKKHCRKYVYNWNKQIVKVLFVSLKSEDDIAKSIKEF